MAQNSVSNHCCAKGRKNVRAMNHSNVEKNLIKKKKVNSLPRLKEK